MSGTDVAPKQAEEHAGEEPEFKQTSPVLAFLKIWLPFPIIFGGILFWQFKSGRLEPAPVERVVTDEAVFEGAGAELPVLLQSLHEERDRLRKEWGDVALARERLLLEASRGRYRDVLNPLPGPIE